MIGHRKLRNITHFVSYVSYLIVLSEVIISYETLLMKTYQKLKSVMWASAKFLEAASLLLFLFEKRKMDLFHFSILWKKTNNFLNLLNF